MNLNEAHSIGTFLQGQDDREEVTKKAAQMVRANAKWTPVDRISWSDLKDRAETAVAIRGSLGSAMIYWNGRNYQVIVGGEPDADVMLFSSGGEVQNYIKPYVGKVRAMAMARDAGRDDMLQARRDRKAGMQLTRTVSGHPASQAWRPQGSTDALKRTIDILSSGAAKYIQAAVANLGGMAQQMIRAENYGGARQKLERMESLQNLLIALDRPSGKDVPRSVKDFVNAAMTRSVQMAYAGEHPDKIRVTRSRYGGGSYEMQPQDYGHFVRWQEEALSRRGSTFSDILNHFKQDLITGKY